MRVRAIAIAYRSTVACWPHVAPPDLLPEGGDVLGVLPDQELLEVLDRTYTPGHSPQCVCHFACIPIPRAECQSTWRCQPDSILKRRSTYQETEWQQLLGRSPPAAPLTASSRKERPDSPTPYSPPAVSILTTVIIRMSGSLMA